jgi:pimeloyl-ACP methyl ester carboxylesterase
MGIINPAATIDDAKQAAAATAGAFTQMTPESYAQMVRSGPNGSTMAAGEADLERIIRWGLASDPATVAAAMTELYSTDLRPELGAIQVPTLALAAWVGYAPYSSHDFVDQTYRAQYASLAGFQLEITDTARHFIMLDEPEWTFARIEAFLAANSRP